MGPGIHRHRPGCVCWLSATLMTGQVHAIHDITMGRCRSTSFRKLHDA